MTRILIIDDLYERDRKRQLVLEQLAILGAGQLDAAMTLKQGMADAESAAWRAEQPRSPWDRGSKIANRGPRESLASMMTRLQRKPPWKKPTIEERNLCDNCDGAPDGGHTRDAWCLWTIEEDL